jgi:iron complex outermembrane receptor protein
MRCALLGSACIMAALTAVPASADDQMETIVVTGIRGSLQRNLDIKRDSSGLVDAITMEDIGKFPDANLAQALMRVPGVTTSYTSNATNNGQSTTTGQGTSITVRGFGPSFNETVFDGRVVPSANGGRSFDFSGLSADMVARLDVLKSPDASLSAGAIGATVNVVYPKPFDKPGLTVAGSFSGNINVDDGRWKPNGNFLVSDTFDNDRFGILVTGAYSSLSVSQNQVQNWGWIGQYIAPCQLATYSGPDCNTLSDDSTKANYSVNKVADKSKPIWWTQDYAVDWNQIQEERMNGRVALQFRPTDALEITVDGNYARDDLMQDSLTYALWNGVGDMRKVKTSSYGTVTSFTRHGPQDFDDVRSQQVQQTYTYGVNAKWTLNDHVTVIADFDQVLSALNPGHLSHFGEQSAGIGYGPSTSAGLYGVDYTVTQAGGRNLPYYSGVGPSGDASKFTGINTGLTADGSILGSHVMVTSTSQNTYLVNQARLESDFEYGNTKIKFGAQYTPEHYTTSSYTDIGGTSNNNWQSFSGYGPDSNNYQASGSTAGIRLPASLFHGVRKIGDIPGWTAPDGGVIPGLPILDAREVYAYINKLAPGPVNCPVLSVNADGSKNYGVPSVNGFNCGGVTSPSGFSGFTREKLVDFDKSSYQKLNEDNYAAYLTFATEAKVADMPLKVAGGVRYEYTRVWAMGFGQNLTGMTVTPGDLTNYNFALGPSSVVAKKNAYSYLLPNIDLNLVVTDDFHIRADASRTMTRPPITDLKGNLTYSGRKGSLSSSGGNPYELPYISDNMDIAAEWYYAQNSYVSVDTFMKMVSNWVVAGTTTFSVPGVIDPNTGAAPVFTLQSNVNGPSANIYGIEIAWQHVFGDSGFGFLLNGTVVGTNKPYDPNNLTVGNFGMPGLADSANATVFYDKDGVELRVAANWRDVYLDKFGQGQSGGTSFGSEPIFINGNWDLTFSGGYEITDNIKAYVSASNLTNNSYSSRGRFPDQVYAAISIGRSFTGGVHFKL